MKLTEQQRTFAEDNLNLVHYVIHRYCGNIRADEYEDIYQTGVIGLCKAVAKFNPAFGIAFSTFAVRCITNEIYMSFRSQKKRNVETISVDTSIFSYKDEETAPLIETIHSVEDTESRIGYIILVDMLKERFDEMDSQIIRMSIDGMTQQQIGDRLGLSQPHVSRKLKRIQEIIRKEYCRVV